MMKNRLLSFITFSLLISLLSLAAKENEKIRIACVGNSITAGVGVEKRFQNSYPGILQQMLGKEYDVRNFGVSNSTVVMQGQQPYMLECSYLAALKFTPNIVTIKLGTNDTRPHNWIFKKSFQKDLERLIVSFKELPTHPQIYLCMPIPSTCVKWGVNNRILENEIIPIIRKVARKQKVKLVDLYTPLMGHPDFFPDCVHPNEHGSAEIASNLYYALTGKKAEPYNPLQNFPGKESEWNGFKRHDFQYNGRDVIVISPLKATPKKPWIWKSDWRNTFSSVNLALLEKGFHVVYYDLDNLYGSPQSVQLGNSFYQMMCNQYRLSSKVTLESFRQGGDFVFNWAAANPEKVACVYWDTPVCHFESRFGREQEELWNDFLQEWNLQDSEVISRFRGNVLELLPKLKRGGVPIIGVFDRDDKAVLCEKNKHVSDAYQAMGGIVEVVLKSDMDHYPHDLNNPERLVDFILRYQQEYEMKQHICRRGNLNNSFLRFQKEKKGSVAFLGGSITEMRGWRDMIKEDLQQRFPDTQFQFIEAGIGSTGSTPHAFRLENDVLTKGKPDLMFVEAAVNDHANGFTPLEQVRGMEGVVRHALQSHPNMDIVMLHFIYAPFIKPLQQGIQPDVVVNHERVANYYNISSINLIQEVVERMADNEFTWKDFGGTHPVWEGHKYYAASINRLFDMETKPVSEMKVTAHSIPLLPLDKNSYFNGYFMDISRAKKVRGFERVENWEPADTNIGRRTGFVNVPMLEAVDAGASFELEFSGRAIGIFCVSGPHAGTLEYSVDGAPFKQINTYTFWSKDLYLPWVYMLETELDEGYHLLRLRVVKGERTECQIRNFVVNGS